jgi:hypothetical protein
MSRRFTHQAALLFVAIACLAGIGTANAGPTSFLDRLFGIERPAPPDQLPVPPGQVGTNLPVPGSPSAPPRKKRPAAPAEPTYPAAVVAPKNADAKKVLVVGDFIASGLAWGLDQAFADEPRVAIVDRTDGPSGFVRNDVTDWAAKIPEILTAEAPDVVVVELGANDRQSIRTKDARLTMRSDAWNAAYQQRVERFLVALQSYGKPVYWVGAPPLKSADANGDVIFLNALFKDKVDALAVNFVDVWDGFADEEGKFIARGPDIDGQARTLRASDGINFTKAGRRKLAFYVERSILEDDSLGLPANTSAQTNPNSVSEIGPDGKERRVGPVVSLTDPAPGAAKAALAGATERSTPEPAAASAQYRLTVEGEAPPSQPGRVDDFGWKPPRTDDADAAPASLVDGIVILPAPAAGAAATP